MASHDTTATAATNVAIAYRCKICSRNNCQKATTALKAMSPPNGVFDSVRTAMTKPKITTSTSTKSLIARKDCSLLRSIMTNNDAAAITLTIATGANELRLK